MSEKFVYMENLLKNNIEELRYATHFARWTIAYVEEKYKKKEMLCGRYFTRDSIFRYARRKLYEIKVRSLLFLSLAHSLPRARARARL